MSLSTLAKMAPTITTRFEVVNEVTGHREELNDFASAASRAAKYAEDNYSAYSVDEVRTTIERTTLQRFG